MNRIETLFNRLRDERRKALVGFLMAGDPDPAQSEKNVRTALEAGVDILELGVPFSDPTADGPVIQAAGQRALAAGMTLDMTLRMAGRIRRDFEAPIILFGYANPFFVHGFERVCDAARKAGVDGLLVVDLPFEESAPLRTCATRAGLALIPLVAPTTPAERMKTILKGARGFVYYIMFRGVTGTRTTVAGDAADHLALLRARTRLPIAAGFGVSTPEQAATVAAHADGVVVGSALVKAAAEGRLRETVKAIRRVLS